MDYKEQFINQHCKKEQTKISYLRTLKMFTQYENRPSCKKDLFNFNDEQLENALRKALQGINENSITTHISIISQYIKWANKMELRTITGNFANTINNVKKDLIENGYSYYANKLLSREEIYKLITTENDKQKLSIVLLLFEGIDGNEHSEIIAIKQNDFTLGSQELKLRERKILVPMDLIITLDLASKEDKVERIINTKNSKTYLRYKQNEYVIKAVERDDIKGDNPSRQIVPSRLSDLRDRLNNENLTPNIIKDSGLCYYLSLLEWKKGELSLEDYAKVAKRYDNKDYKSYSSLLYIRRLYQSYKETHNVKFPIINEELEEIIDEILSYEVSIPENAGHKKKSKKLADKAKEERHRDIDKLKQPDKKLGDKGELIIERYLRWKYKNDKTENVANKCIGYDLEVMSSEYDHMCIEVKSTRVITDRIQIYISNHELKKAKEQGENYYLYILYFKEEKAKELYVIQNPIKVLNFENHIEFLIKEVGNRESYIVNLLHLINIDIKLLSQYEEKEFVGYLREV